MRGDILHYRDLPIPDPAESRALRKTARKHPIDISHPLHKEGYADVRAHNLRGENFYHRESGNHPYHHRAPGSIPHLFLRHSVIQKFLSAERVFRDVGYALYFFDCYRPVAVQEYFFGEWMPAWVRKQHPDWDDERVFSRVCDFWAVVSHDPASPPPHATGAVADVFLLDKKTGGLVDFGTSFDDFSDTDASATYYLEQRLLSGGTLSDAEMESLRMRRMFYWVLSFAGLANNPNELWHWSSGDQLYARLVGEDAACYSFLEL